MFVGADRAEPPLPEELEGKEVSPRSVWRALVEPAKQPARPARAALKDYRSKVSQ